MSCRPTSWPLGWSWPAGQPIEIGVSHDGYWKKLNGQMDDFRIYNRVLTDSEISSIYTSDALVQADALLLRYNFNTSGVGTSDESQSRRCVSLFHRA